MRFLVVWFFIVTGFLFIVLARRYGDGYMLYILGGVIIAQGLDIGTDFVGKIKDYFKS